jgi:hypothetical protein
LGILCYGLCDIIIIYFLFYIAVYIFVRNSYCFVFHWTGTPAGLQSKYPSEVTEDSETYSRTCSMSNYYYETIRVKVVETGLYVIASTSNINTYGYIYKSNFNPFNPSENLLLEDDDTSCERHQFQLITYLQTNNKYVLVVTTFFPEVTGDFSIFVFGPNKVYLKSFGESFRKTFLYSENSLVQ